VDLKGWPHGRRAHARWFLLRLNRPVGGLDHLATIFPFEPAHREVARRNILKVVGERAIDEGARGGSQDGNHLERSLLGNDDTKSGCDAANEIDHAGQTPIQTARRDVLRDNRKM
jgi:hypothetical protein